MLFVSVMAIAVLLLYVLSNMAARERPDAQALVLGYKDATYVIDGREITLKDGLSDIAMDKDSATKVITRYVGNELRHDLNADGREDVAFILTQQTGGTGTFFYVVAALNMPKGYVGSHAIFLGDRIVPQAMELSRDPGHKDVIEVNFADRNPEESFAEPPSVGRSMWLKFDPALMRFEEVL